MLIKESTIIIEQIKIIMNKLAMIIKESSRIVNELTMILIIKQQKQYLCNLDYYLNP